MKIQWLLIFPLLFVVGCKEPGRVGGGASTTKPTAGTNEMTSTSAPAPAVGDVAPPIEGPDLDGIDFKLSDYRGKVVVLDFWGDW